MYGPERVVSSLSHEMKKYGLHLPTRGGNEKGGNRRRATIIKRGKDVDEAKVAVAVVARRREGPS